MAGVEIIIKTETEREADDLAMVLEFLIRPFLPPWATFKWAKGSWHIQQDFEEE